MLIATIIGPLLGRHDPDGMCVCVGGGGGGGGSKFILPLSAVVTEKAFICYVCNLTTIFYILRSDEEAGFAEDKRVESQQKRYKLDTNSIQLSTDIIGKAGKKLFKVQEKISRKEQQEKSKKLGKCKENYDYWLTELKKELKRLNAVNIYSDGQKKRYICYFKKFISLLFILKHI